MEFAIKKMQKIYNSSKIEREFQNLMQMNHSNIIRLIEKNEDDENSYLKLEYF